MDTFCNITYDNKKNMNCDMSEDISDDSNINKHEKLENDLYRLENKVDVLNKSYELLIHSLMKENTYLKNELLDNKYKHQLLAKTVINVVLILTIYVTTGLIYYSFKLGLMDYLSLEQFYEYLFEIKN